MPLETKTYRLIRECYEQVSELERLVTTNQSLDQRRAFIAMQYSLLSTCERNLSYENDARDSNSNISYDDDNEQDIENLSALLKRINQMIDIVRKEIVEQEAKQNETNIALAKLLPACRMALRELEFMASFYPEDTDPWAMFRKELQSDLDKYKEWALEEQIPNFKTIALGCRNTLTTARQHFLHDNDKFNHSETQATILRQFKDLWQQMKQIKTPEAMFTLYQLRNTYRHSQQLDTLIRKHAASEINLQGYRKSIVELQGKTGCMPFTFGFRAYLEARSSHAAALQESNTAQILKACKSMLAGCLRMKQYLLTHPQHETVAIVPVPQFA